MGRKRAAFYLSLFAGALVLGLSIFGFVGLLGRPDMPWDALARAAGLPREVLPRSVVRVDGFEVRDVNFDFKFVAARRRIGDPIEFVIMKDGRELAVCEPLVSNYAKEGYPLVYLLTGGLGFLIGFAVFVLRADDSRAGLFFWLCLAFSAAVMISGEWYGVQGRVFHLVPGVLFFFAYTLTPILLLRFALTFTARNRLPGAPLLWGGAVLFGGFFSAVFVASFLIPSAAVFRLKTYFTIFRGFFAVLCIVAFVVLYRAYRASPSRERRDQIRWVLYGMIGGLAPFMFLYQIPLVLGLGAPLSEEVASAFFVFLPVALAFAILKYKLMDVHVIINKSVVYSLLTMVTVGVYLVSIEGLERLFAGSSGSGGKWIPMGAAFIAALAFAPARARIQVIVDRAFFRRGYDYRRAVLGFSTAAEKAWSAGDLVALFSDALAETLPVEKVGAFVPPTGAGTPGITLRSGLDDAAIDSLVAAPPGSKAPLSREKLEGLGFEAALPVPLGEGGPSGWVLVGRKRSGLEFTDEDRELLATLALELAAALRRVRLQEEVIYERASRERSEELGRLKTEFISLVSHELRTPMASLQSISELLKSGKVADPSRRERLLELMAGECGRLGRYLHNVLDFGRIEQDAKRYGIREMDLNAVVADVVEVVKPAAAEDGFELAVETPEGPVRIEADPDAVRQALLNLVDNAFKYSAGRKRVAVRLAEGADGAEVSVRDHGIGIPAEDQERIFEAFYRSPGAVRHDPKGVGLGLKIVKHIMDAHGGTVGFVSEPGRGTTFTLKFPKRRNP